MTSKPSALPFLVSWKYKWPAGVLTLLFSGCLYFLSNHFPIREPRLLWLTEIDRSIPFIPWTVWIYASGILFFIVVYYLNRCVVSLNLHLYSFLSLVLISNLIFWIFPTVYPREFYPIPPGVDPLTRTSLEIIRALDRPANCAPSLHVSIAFLIAFGFLEDLQQHFKWIFIWAVLMGLSTLTTKQHYCWDVASGLVLAILLFGLFHRHLKLYRPR